MSKRAPLVAGAVALGVAVALAAAVAPDAEARPRPAGKRASTFQANKTFGLGIMLGSPSGLSGKYFLGPDTALDFGIGAIGCCRGRRGLHVHLDHLWHPVSLASDDAFELPLYLGIGGRLWDFRRRDDDRHGTAIGVRAPIGIAMDFNNVPLDIFLELALVLDLFIDYVDDVDVDLNGAIGVRYYFN